MLNDLKNGIGKLGRKQPSVQTIDLPWPLNWKDSDYQYATNDKTFCIPCIMWCNIFNLIFKLKLKFRFNLSVWISLHHGLAWGFNEYFKVWIVENCTCIYKCIPKKIGGFDCCKDLYLLIDCCN